MNKTWYLDSRKLVAGQKLVRVNGDVPSHLKAFSQKDLRKYRAELRRLANDGFISDISFEADVYHDIKNENNFIIPADELPKFAPSFRGQPFLQDHAQQQMDFRMGTIDKSTLTNGKTIEQTINITSEHGIKAFIDGKIDRFSIGWKANEAKCSLCNNDVFSCEHWPGVKYEGKLCSVVFRGVRGVETSAVNRPAVPGTGLLHQFLSEAQNMKKGTVPSTLADNESLDNDVELDTQLSVDEGDSESNEDEIAAFQEALGLTQELLGVVEVVQRLQARIEFLETQLADVNEAVADLNAQPVLTQLVNSIRKPKTPASVPGHVPADKTAGTQRVPYQSQQASVTQKRGQLLLNKLAQNKEG